MMRRQLTLEAITRAARLYRSTSEAAQALGVAPGSFARACHKAGILTPNERRRLNPQTEDTPYDYTSAQRLQ